jgi:hypothetical protein
MRRGSNPFQAGLLAAILAATLQFVLWAGVLPGAMPSAAGAQAASFHAPICGAGSPADQQPAPHAPCLLCPVCMALSLAATLPPPPPTPQPALLAGRIPSTADAARTLPPGRRLAAAYPRGPPLT